MINALKRKERRALRSRYRLRQNNAQQLPRLSVFLSHRALYTQIIDDVNSVTLTHCSTKELNHKNITCAHAELVGIELAKRAKELNIHRVIFDKGPYIFGKRLSALLEGVRDGQVRV